MQLWTYPRSYIGKDWSDYYVFLGKNRDSDALTRSNFRVALEKLGGETGKVSGDMFHPGPEHPLITVVRESHWACGWLEWIAIHKTASESIKLAESIESELDAYSVLDDQDFSELEDEECCQIWEAFSPNDRLEYFRHHGYSASSIQDLFQAIRSGNWYDAANLLNCPSDLLY